jgi:hypothetical protein
VHFALFSFLLEIKVIILDVVLNLPDMDSQTFISRLGNANLLKNDKSIEWQTVTEKYPYFNVGQILKYGHGVIFENANLEFTSLYKQDPICFLRWHQQFCEVKSNTIQFENVDIGISDRNEFVERVTESQQQNVIEETNDFDSIIDTTEIEELLLKLNSIGNSEIVINDSNELDMNQSDYMNEVPFQANKNHDMVVSPSEIIHANEKHDLHDLSNKATVTIEKKSESQNSQVDFDDKSLLVMMSFTEWLEHFKTKNNQEREEHESKKALKTAWQKEKLQAAVEEEGDEIPEQLFKQAMDSISVESTMISESLAGILAKQGKIDRAIEMYTKLSLRNPEKSTYFANLIHELNHSNN